MKKIKGIEVLECPSGVGKEELAALVKYFTEQGPVPTGWSEYVWGLAMSRAYMVSFSASLMKDALEELVGEN